MQYGYSAFGFLTLKTKKDKDAERLMGWIRDLECAKEFGADYKRVKKVKAGEYVMPVSWGVDLDEQYSFFLNHLFSSAPFGTDEAEEMDFTLSFRFWDCDYFDQYFKGSADFVSKKGTTTLTGWASEEKDNDATINDMAIYLGGLDDAMIVFANSMIEQYADAFFSYNLEDFTNAPETEKAVNELKEYQEKYNAALLAIEPGYFELPERTREEFQKKYAIKKEVNKTMEDADELADEKFDELQKKLEEPYKNIFNLKERRSKIFK